jgi:hypothetical protein
MTAEDDEDTMLRNAFRALEGDVGTLDAEHVIAGGKRRRAQRRTATAATASALTAGVLVAGNAMSGLLTGSDGDAPVASTPAISQSALKQPPLIRDNTWIQLSNHDWFHMRGTSWKMGEPPQTKEWKGSGNSLNEADLTRGWHEPSTGGSGSWLSTLTFLRGDIRKATYTVTGERGTFSHAAKLYRLQSVRGWVIAHREYPAPGPANSYGALDKLEVNFDAYDAQGRHVLHCEPPDVTRKGAPVPPVCTVPK